MRSVLKILFLSLCFVVEALAQDGFELPAFDFPDNPERWREEDFEKRFKGTYGINAYLEPELDVDNYNVYEGVLAFLDNSEGAITYIENSIAALKEQQIEVSASLNFLLGNFHFSNDAHELATQQYIEAIHKHPSFLRAYENLGYSFMQVNQNEKALPVLIKALELGSNDSQIHGLIGFLYLEKEIYLSALAAFESAMLFNPRNNTWRFGILQCLIQLERHEDALGVAKEILLFDPDNPSNWQNVANIHLRMEHEEEGMSHLEVTHSLGGGSYVSRRLLGNMYFNREMVEQAAVEFTEMVNLATAPEELEDVLQVCEGFLYFGFVEEAQLLLNELTVKASDLELELDAISLKMVDAMIAMEGGRSDFALRTFLEVLDENPAQPRALLFVGQLYSRQGDIDEAGVYYELAQMYPVVSYDALYAHAELLLGLGKRDEALDKLRQAAAIRPSEGLSQIIRSVEDTGRLVR